MCIRSASPYPASFVCCTSALPHAMVHTNSGYTAASEDGEEAGSVWQDWSIAQDPSVAAGQSLACVPCPAGYYKDAPGSSACLKCAAGRYVNRTGQVACPPNDDVSACTQATCRWQSVASPQLHSAGAGQLLPAGMALLDASSLLLSIPNARQMIGLDTVTAACTLSLRDERSFSTEWCETVLETPVNTAAGLVVTQHGHVLFADTESMTIRSFHRSAGPWSASVLPLTVSLTARGWGGGEQQLLHGPVGLALSSSEETLYVLDRNRVLNVSLDSTYVTSVVAGQLAAGYADGIGSKAGFLAPKALVLAHSLGSKGTIYVTDWKGHRVRQIDVATQAVSTLAGYAWKQGMEDGVGSKARFISPFALALTPDHTRLYVTDYAASNIRVIEVQSGAVSTLMPTPPQTVGLLLQGPGSGGQGAPTDLTDLSTAARIDSLFLASQVSKT